jgi:hypothetical protein
MKTRTILVRGREHGSAHDALVELNFSGDHAVSLGGRFLTVTEAEMQRLQAAGVQPTTWHHHRPTDRVLSVPGNQD